MPPVRNLHVTLPEDLHVALREEAARSGRPATELAREALRDLLARRRREALSRQIAAYASHAAGTRHDMDPELEAAAVERLLDEDRVETPLRGTVWRAASRKTAGRKGRRKERRE